MRRKPLPQNIKENLAPGLVVFLVALPLCMGIALASGAPPLSGIIGGIIGGIVIGAMSNSHISVSGPAAGLAAIVYAAIQNLGTFELFLLAGVIAGGLQLALGFMRAGSISNYFPSNVIEGMLAGIGIIIILKQIPHALGYDEENFASQVVFDKNNLPIFEFFHKLLDNIQPGVIIVTLISIGILLLFDNVQALKKIKLLPGALVAVVVGILINELFKISAPGLVIEPSHLVQLPIPRTSEDFAALVTFPDVSGILNPQVWIAGFTIAVVASIETLLCIEAADRMDSHRRITDTNNELRAQGIGNIASAMIGGLPITSVIVRSSANANAGATTKMAAIIHGVMLLVAVLAIPFLLNLIPLATLAAVLLVIGYKLAKPATMKHFWSLGRFQFIPFIATVIAVVATDLLTGVGIGMAISVFFILQGNMKRSYYLSREELREADDITIELAEEVSFLNKAAIKKTLKNVKPNSKVTIDAKYTSYIAHDILELIQDFANVRAKDDDIEVVLNGFRTEYMMRDDEHAHVKVMHRRSM
ncbi:MAG: SulP family inorganic anion transporter [Weeksellaceae bacterium]|nr:SulP family inorganic anion transporter [Weeksellaceae bacterium]